MGTQLTNYQCPSCTGPLHYSGTTGKMECEYCGTSYEPSAIEELYADREAAAAKAAAQTPWEPELLGGEWDEEEAQSRFDAQIQLQNLSEHRHNFLSAGVMED